MLNRKRKLMMTGIASLVIIAVLGLFSMEYLTTTPSQQATVDGRSIYSSFTQNLGDDEAEIIIIAPTEVKIGELVILDVSQSIANEFEWMIVPETDDFLIIDDGRRAVFSSGVAGEFMFIIAGAVGDSVDVKRHVVRVVGNTPPPEPVDPIDPDDPVSALSEKVGSWCGKIQSPTRTSDATKIAAAFESIAAQIDAGTLTEPHKIVLATSKANREALGDQLQAWIPFLRSLQAELEQQADDGLLVTPAQHSVTWKEIAKGLRYFANSKLK